MIAANRSRSRSRADSGVHEKHGVWMGGSEHPHLAVKSKPRICSLSLCRQVAEPRRTESDDSMLCHLAGFRSLPVAVALVGGIFLIDTLSSLQFAVASLYVIVVLIAAHDLHRRGVVITGVTCAFLTVFCVAPVSASRPGLSGGCPFGPDRKL